jgi:peptide deformylase
MPLEIAQLGQPVLWEAALDVSREQIADAGFQAFLADMLETMRHEKGVGLAAPQVFLGLRVFLAALAPPVDEDTPPEVEVFINPKITPLTDEIARAWEGCLSFAELLVFVPRFRAVRIDYLNAQGKPCALELQGFPARVVQHEYDHLDGILTIDRAESTRHIIKASELEDVMEGMDETEDE